MMLTYNSKIYSYTTVPALLPKKVRADHEAITKTKGYFSEEMDQIFKLQVVIYPKPILAMMFKIFPSLIMKTLCFYF